MAITVDVEIFEAGHCRSRAWLVERGSFFRSIYLPAMVAVIRHPDAGAMLFDTGYGRPLVESVSWAARMYRVLLPFQLSGEDKLRETASKVKLIFLSHFHPDHIGSLKELPTVPIIHSREGLAKLRRYGGFQKARAAFFPELLPSDFLSRARAIEDLPGVTLDESWRPFTEAFDVFGDGSVLAVALPGHAVGQYGVLCRRRAGWVFLVADAAWTRRNITDLATPGWPAGALIGDAPAYRATLQMMHEFQRRRPDVMLIPSHCHESIEAFRNVP